jgi:hypothetical protein
VLELAPLHSRIVTCIAGDRLLCFLPKAIEILDVFFIAMFM